MESCLYEGEVRHRRMLPIEHTFRYRMFMLYIDLDELDNVFRGTWLWSVDGWGLANIRRRDHHGCASDHLSRSIRDLVADKCGRRPDGPIRLLTMPSCFGYRFNPVSFYYCYAADGVELQTIVAEVNNTPWNEQHCYVLDSSQREPDDRLHRHRFAKQFHVSPFMSMSHHYDWRFSLPGERLSVHMENFEQGEKLFDASMSLRRREISPSALRGVLLRYPLMAFRVISAIYVQAARLWWKRAPFFPHPATRADLARKSA
ncbi:MAG: DUF1365 domain-containing protein [Phycisphaerales bacterium]|nr:DUF1365 domain-containing protein [Phycisphaerales bacterium]MCB9858571.1 DUF1365 domain-containing protein [Phycisphaerales bacterium]